MRDPSDPLISAAVSTVPAIYVLAITRLTPFGARDWSLERTLPYLPTAHFIAWSMMTLGLSLLACRWRLRKRAGLLGVGGRSWVERFGWLSMLVLAVFVPLIGAYVSILRPLVPDVWWLGAFLVPAGLWLVTVAMKAPLGKSGERITASASARVMSSVMACPVVLMMALAVAFEREDAYWFGRYAMIRTGGDGNPYTAHEAAVQRSIQRELLGILDGTDVRK